MRNDTHGALIIGDGFSAFVDGIPDKCEHDDNGPVLSFNSEGEYFKDSEMPDYKTNPDGWRKFQDAHKINGGCVSCSKCGKPYTPDFFNMP
ncbi:MAG TPA: hypothetical protein VK590_14925 [Saprospiraceae bacterium]|nr:hypothetical protein [Saprospiraceae bacterium]